MTTNRGLIVVMSLALVMMRPAPAAAQLSSRDGSTVSLPVAVGDKISVTTADGRRIKGQVLRLSPTTLDIGKHESVTTSLAIADVARIQESDSVNNGVMIGALSLGAVGAFWGLAGDTGTDLVSGVITGESAGTNYTLVGTLVGVSVGALVGYALDAGKEKTIYERGTAGMSVAVQPIVSAAGKGVGLTLRW